MPMLTDCLESRHPPTVSIDGRRTVIPCEQRRCECQIRAPRQLQTERACSADGTHSDRERRADNLSSARALT